MFTFIVLFCFVVSSIAENHVIVLLVTAPKKIPMIVYTAEYLANAYKNGHEGIIIDGVFITKGCDDCNYPDMQEAVDIMKEAGIPVYLTANSDFGKKNKDEKYQKWLSDYFQPWYYQTKFDIGTMMKFNVVNHYFNYTLDTAMKTFPNFDYVLYLEDDVAIHRDCFKRMSQIMDEYDSLKNKVLSTQLCCWFCNLNKGIYDNMCIFGFYGKMFHKSQLRKYLKLQKFEKYVICGDAVECPWTKAGQGGKYFEKLMYHFGRDHKIQRKDPQYY